MVYRISRCFVFMVFFLLSQAVLSNEDFGYKLDKNLVYGTGEITNTNGKVVRRDLLMDVYRPEGLNADRNLPAVVLVHGGAFHRGGLRQPPYKEAGAVHSRMEDYARLLAPLGYVCFVIEYRLIPEMPVPKLKPNAAGMQDYRTAITPEGIARVNYARRAMGLSEIGDDEKLVLWNGPLAAAEDTYLAVSNIRERAAEFGIDPERIALGGHSAGGASALNAAYGLNAPVAAVFPMSPGLVGFDLSQVIDRDSLPPMLLLTSQNDEPAVSQGIPFLIDVVEKAQLEYEFAWVPGFAHFYPTGAVALGNDGGRMSVGELVQRFLERHIGPGELQ